MLINKYLPTVIFILFITLFIGTLDVSASVQLSIIRDTKNPEPGENVEFQIKSPSIDLERHLINWVVDGITIQEEMGGYTFITKAPKLGNTKTITAIVSSKTNWLGEKTTTLKSQLVNIIWEARTYTPPWYKGKALYTHKSAITFTAIPEIILPNGDVVDPSDLFYIWKQNDINLTNHRGVGRQSTTIKIAPGYNKIGVVVETLDGKYRASNEITVDESDAELILYEYNPLYGLIFNQALKNDYDIKDVEMTFTVIPYFFSTTAANSSFINYFWEMNNKPLDILGNTETLRNETSESGDAHLYVKAKHTKNILQSASDEINISF